MADKLTSVFQQVALQCHQGQTRKGSRNEFPLSYIHHPFAVAETVWQWGAGTPVNFMASYGHDICEDCNISIKELKELVEKKFR